MKQSLHFIFIDHILNVLADYPDCQNMLVYIILLHSSWFTSEGNYMQLSKSGRSYTFCLTLLILKTAWLAKEKEKTGTAIMNRFQGLPSFSVFSIFFLYTIYML